jgi:N-acetyl-alpha-D-muramate 1-phosphate uridylyltransferase
MKINTALILCAGFGKRLNPITLGKPKPLVEINNITILETCIELIENLGIKKIIINTFYLKEQISNFLKNKNYNCEIKIIDDGKNILDTGGGILNMTNQSNENDFLIFNPDTLWKKTHLTEIVKMQEFYFSKKIENILLLVNKNLSFDKNLNGDFDLENNLISKNEKKEFIYTGCQILNKKLLLDYKVENFSITNVWSNLIQKKRLFGFESFNNFYHLTDLEIFKKLQDL